MIIFSGVAWSEMITITNRISGGNFLIKLLISFYACGVFAASTIGLYFIDPFFLFYILSICICSDIGGYIVGKKIGGKKLIKISPKKTISGSLGSFCFSLLPLLLFYNFNQSEYSYSINNFLLCLEISLICQLGDLFISYLKRKAKVKDTGTILPGHGGLLDRIDGIIFAMPFVYIYHTGLIKYFETWTEQLSNIFKYL